MPFLPESIVHALRFCRRDASVAAPAVAILALGLGANLAIFGVAYAVLLRPLPVADQQSLVIMWERAEQRAVSVWEVSYRNFIDWESRNRVLHSIWPRPARSTGRFGWCRRDGPVILPFAAVSGTFFDVLGTRAALGRALTRADDARSSPGVAVLSDRNVAKSVPVGPGRHRPYRDDRRWCGAICGDDRRRDGAGIRLSARSRTVVADRAHARRVSLLQRATTCWRRAISGFCTSSDA